jgi:hypothetical protein
MIWITALLVLSDARTFIGGIASRMENNRFRSSAGKSKKYSANSSDRKDFSD